MRQNRTRLRAGVAALSLTLAVAFPAAARAASYSDLASQGFATSAMTKSRGGNLGWYLTRGPKRYFCKLHAATVLEGANGVVVITSSGRQITIDKHADDKFRGGKDTSLPHLEDLKAGRVRPRDVGACTVG